MLSFPATLKIYLAVEPVDMRNQYNGLGAAMQRKGAAFMSCPKCTTPESMLKQIQD